MEDQAKAAGEARAWEIFVMLMVFTFLILLLKFLAKLTVCKTKFLSKNCQLEPFSFCNLPDCVRCTRNEEMFKKAREKFQTVLLNSDIVSEDQSDEAKNSNGKILTALSHIGYSKKKSNESNINAMQKPVVLEFPELRSQAVWDAQKLNDTNILRSQFSAIIKEFDSVYKENLGKWLTNKTPKGCWKIFHLFNQGNMNKENTDLCPKTMDIIDSLPNVMTNSLFGTVAFSVLEPGTTITEHYGPTNVRLRCHLGLACPSDCYLQVGIEKAVWTEKQCVVFDDSFLHKAVHQGSRLSGKMRAVLIVDLWHPDLTTYEKELINMIFSPS